MRELMEKQKAIELLRSQLNKMIEMGNGIHDENFIRANRKLDLLIEDYIELELQMNAGNL